MAGIAISYRREDTGWITGRIFDRLKGHYEQSGGKNRRNKSVVFMDYDSTPVGVDFRKYIKDILDHCDVLLAIIGPRWAGDDGQHKPRIMQESDWVRIEIETALKNNVAVIPILIDRTPMPSPDALPEGLRDLAYRQAAIIDTQIDFNSHIERLIREIDRLVGIAVPREASQPSEAIQMSQSPPVSRGGGSLASDRIAPIPVGVLSLSCDERNGRSASSRWLRISRPVIACAVTVILVCALVATAWRYFDRAKSVVDPIYAGYSSPELGVSVLFPNNILTLDTTERKQRKLVLRDSDGQAVIRVLRTALPDHKDVKRGRQDEIAQLTQMNFVLTYIAPEKEQNWTNWYVLSGVNHGTEFYFRRWYSEDSMVSMEFMYAKAAAPLFDKLIPTMTHELMMTNVAPKIEP